MRKNMVFTLTIIILLFLSPPILASQHTGTALSADSVPISYTIQGEGEPALVFVHCWCCDRSYWKDQIPRFSKSHTVVALDLAGHGESGLERNEWTLDAFAEDVASVVRTLDLGQVILVGHSMGGPIALEAAVLLKDRVIGIVGVDTYQNFGATFGEEMRKQFLAPFEADFAGRMKSFVGNMFPPGADSSLVDKIAADMSSAPPVVGIGALKNMLAFDPAVLVGKIDVPIYAINSDKFPTNVEGNEKLAPTFRAKFMPGVGHFVMIEDPERFNRLLEEAVNEITAAK